MVLLTDASKLLVRLFGVNVVDVRMHKNVRLSSAFLTQICFASLMKSLFTGVSSRKN
jgi:hypothetical protein